MLAGLPFGLHDDVEAFYTVSGFTHGRRVQMASATLNRSRKTIANLATMRR
jgi:hypothetical protein